MVMQRALSMFQNIADVDCKDPSSAEYQRSALACYVGPKEFTFYSLSAWL